MDKEYQTITIERDTGTARYTILNTPERLQQILNKLAIANKPESDAELFAKARRDQMRTHANPTERARVLAEFREEEDDEPS